MKQLLILSGKGGTGKTTLAGAFIRLAKAKAYADCDVDAPNLHLAVRQPVPPESTDYYGLPKAVIDPEKCSQCDLCRQHCRFEAVRRDGVYQVDPFACEGCAVCAAVCPSGAITLLPAVAGELMLYRHEAVFSTAKLRMGSGTSGKLVTEVKKQLKTAAQNAELAIIDGSPGIGCPVIASLSGADMVLIVAEPSVSGISDMERIIRTAAKFGMKIAVCVNKYDANPGKSDEIEDFCRRHQLAFTGRIPYDPEAVRAVNEGFSIVERKCPSGRATGEVFQATMRLMFEEA